MKAPFAGMMAHFFLFLFLFFLLAPSPNKETPVAEKRFTRRLAVANVWENKILEKKSHAFFKIFSFVTLTCFFFFTRVIITDRLHLFSTVFFFIYFMVSFLLMY